MAKSAASYESSRFNALTYGIHQEGPIHCVGLDRCRYGYCADGGHLPSDRQICSHEAEYARRLESEFRDKWAVLTILLDVDGFEDLVAEFVNIHLQRSRAMSRMNDSWAVRQAEGARAATREFELANLYLDRLQGRQDRLERTLHEALDEMRERATRLRPHVEMIELFVTGRQRAHEEALTPGAPLWDEFADGPPGRKAPVTNPS